MVNPSHLDNFKHIQQSSTAAIFCDDKPNIRIMSAILCLILKTFSTQHQRWRAVPYANYYCRAIPSRYPFRIWHPSAKPASPAPALPSRSAWDTPAAEVPARSCRWRAATTALRTARPPGARRMPPWHPRAGDQRGRTGLIVRGGRFSGCPQQPNLRRQAT
jgi:hypothetical protein